MAGEMNETNIQHLQVTLETFDAKIKQLKKLDENISSKIETEKELETEIAEADCNCYRVRTRVCVANFRSRDCPRGRENIYLEQEDIFLFTKTLNVIYIMM